MNTRLASALDLARSTRGQTAIRYSVVSGISIAITATVIFVLSFFFHWTDRTAAIGGAVAAGVPSYYLNRRWVWGRSGRSRLWREVVPFWVIAFVGLAFSTWAADFAGSLGDDLTDRRVLRSLVVVGGSLAAYAALWVAKFIVFNKILFADHGDDRAAP
ncbi:MAG TPA: GtrA family protein [Acidimicrobiales bacterium]|nr:GtrA family protein [Acidimicrobiales bacterium]